MLGDESPMTGVGSRGCSFAWSRGRACAFFFMCVCVFVCVCIASICAMCKCGVLMALALPRASLSLQSQCSAKFAKSLPDAVGCCLCLCCWGESLVAPPVTHACIFFVLVVVGGEGGEQGRMLRGDDYVCGGQLCVFLVLCG
jgi:hypothetical protein